MAEFKVASPPFDQPNHPYWNCTKKEPLQKDKLLSDREVDLLRLTYVGIHDRADLDSIEHLSMRYGIKKVSVLRLVKDLKVLLG